MRKRNVVIGVVVAVVVLGAWGSATGAGGRSGPRGGSFGGVTSAASGAPTAEVTAPTTDPVAADPAATPAPAPTYTLPGHDPSWTPPPVEPPSEYEMPDLVGDDLDEVEEVLELLGARYVKTTDVSGDGRAVIVSRNWKVCTQQPSRHVDVQGDDFVWLGVVKSSERCP